MSEVKEPPVSYITKDEDMFFYVTEYDGEDLEIAVQHECVIEKLGYAVTYHAATLDKRISHGAFRLYCLYHYWAHNKGRAWPSLATISKHLGVSRSSIVAYNKELEKTGYIYRRSRKSDSGDKRLSALVIIRSIKGNEDLTRLAAGIFVRERGLELKGGQPAEQGVQYTELSGQPVGQEELTIEEGITEEDEASPPLQKRQERVYSKPYSLTVYYKDKTIVTPIGTVKKGPWAAECPACLENVHIEKLNVPYECLCGMHEFTLVPKKPVAKPKQRKHEAVEAYYTIVKSRGVKYGGNEAYEDDIAATVTDIQFWRQAVKEYIHPDFKGNPHAVDKMLVYYKEKRLPGTRKKKEPEIAPRTFQTIEDPPDEPTPEGGTIDMAAIRREVEAETAEVIAQREKEDG